MKVALVYDRVNKWGGAERILLALHEMFPDAPLFSSVYSRHHAPWANVFSVKTSFLQNFPNASTSHEMYAPLMPLAFESFSFDGFDLVISITSEAAKGIMTKPETKHICYCLTPTRYLWSGYKEYFTDPFMRGMSKPIVDYLRAWDVIAAQRPDAYIAISQEVSQRIQQYYGRKASVVYPPLGFTLTPENTAQQSEDDYFLVVSRLVPYKRVDIAIEACNRLGKKLIVIGSGSEEAALRRLAGPHVSFVSNLTDAELSRYYNGCSALIFPGIEDFGLVVAEAQMHGKPVIAFRGGGALEIIAEKKTGEFFSPQHHNALSDVLRQFSSKRYKEKDCIDQVKKYNKEGFKKNFLSMVEELMRKKYV